MKKLQEGHILGILIMLVWLGAAVSQVYGMPWDTPTTQTWYHQTSTHTVNGDLGYQLNLTQGDTSTFVEQDWSGVRNITFSWNIILVDTDGSETSLGTHVANSTRSVNGTGLQTATWTPALTALYFGYDAIKLQALMNVNGSSQWDIEATFMSYVLPYKELQNSTWTFKTYTQYTYSGSSNSTRGYVFWGDLTYETRVEGVSFSTLSPWEMMMAELRQGDYIQFVLTPWTYWLGNLCYGIAVLFLTVTMYIRYGDVRPLIVMFWIFGGTGGVASILIPSLGLHLSWLLLALALAGTLYSLIR